MIQKITRSLRKRGIFGLLAATFADLLEWLSHRLILFRDHYSPYNFTKRGTEKTTLIIVLAGYKSYLWPATLKRLQENTPNNADLCIVSAGIYSKELAEICACNNWSYLSVKRNSPGVALNKAIALHPAADYIYKLDEDIFISSNFFQLLRNGYDYAWQNSMLEPGFVAPVLNVNGISYRIFLRKLGLEPEYQKQFGQLLTRCGDLPIHNNPNASWWIWKNTLPFDKKAKIFEKEIEHYSVCSTRFSIGAILIRRKFIVKIGGFKSSWHSGVLGIDEDVLCQDCVSQSRPMYIIESVLAGHFSFYPQEKFMKQKLSEMSSLDPITFPESYYASAINE